MLNMLVPSFRFGLFYFFLQQNHNNTYNVSIFFCLHFLTILMRHTFGIKKFMSSISIDITANYKQVDEAIKKIEELKKVLKDVHVDDPRSKVILSQIEDQKKVIDELTEQVRKLKEEQAQQVQSAINDSKRQEQEIARLAQSYKALYEQMNAEAGKTKRTVEVIPPSAAQTQATAQVNQQRSAYDNLNEEITKVNGTLDQHVAKLIREQGSLAKVKNELANLAKQEKDNGSLNDKQKQRREELTRSLYEYKQNISSLQQSIRNDVKLNKAAQGSIDELSLSLGKMRDLYRSMSATMQSSSFGKALLSEIKNVDAEVKRLDASLGNHQRNVGNYASALDDASVSLNDMMKNISALPGPIGQSASAMQGLTKASLRFIATPIGSVLAGISLALMALTSWFKRTREGEEALNVTSAYFKQTLDSILDVVDDVGEWLYKAFTKPKEGAKDLVDFIKDHLMNHLNALGKVGAAVWKILGGEVGEGLKDLGNAIAQGFSGIEDPLSKASKFMDDIIDKGNKHAELARRENALENRRTAWIAKRAEIEARISELREKSQNAAYSDKERLEASKEASKLVKEMYNEEVDIAQERFDIIKETNSLSHSNGKALREQAEAEAEVNKLMAERASKNRELLSQQREINNRMKAQGVSANKEKVETSERLMAIEEGRKKIQDKELEVEMQIQQTRINAMKEGSDKRIAQLRLDYKKQTQEVTKLGEVFLKAQQEIERKAFEAANPKAEEEGKAFTPTTTKVSELPQEQLQLLADMLAAITIETQAKEAELLKGTLDKYKDYAKQREDIEKQYNEDVKFLQSQRNEENAKQIDSALKEADKKRKESLSKINLEELKENIDWTSVFGNLDRVATEALSGIKEKLQQYLQDAVGTISKEDFKTVSDAIEQINEAMTDRKPIDQLRQGYDEYKETIEEVAVAQKELNDLESSGAASKEALEMANKKLTESLNKRRSSLVKMTSAINSMGEKGQDIVTAGNNIADMLTDLGVSVPESISKALDGVSQVMSSLASIDLTKPFSVITSATGIIGGIGKAIGGLFGGGKNVVAQETIDSYNNLMEVMDGVISRQQELLDGLSGADAMEAYNRAKDLIEKQIDMTKKLGLAQLNAGSSSGSHSYGYRAIRDLRAYDKELKAIGIDLDSLGGRAEGLFELDPEVIRQLKDDVPEAWFRIDDDARGYLETLIDLDDKTKELEEDSKEALTGISFDSARSELRNLLLDTDTTMAEVAEHFEDYMRQAIVNTIIDKTLSERIKKWYEKFSEAMADGELSDLEKRNLQETYKKIYEDAAKERDAAFEAAGLEKETKTEDQKATARGFETMTQDQAAELNGRFTALQESGNVISEQNLTQTSLLSSIVTSIGGVLSANDSVRDIAGEIRDFQVQSFLEIQEINDTTKSIDKTLKKMSQNIEQVKINTGGI